MTNVNPNNGIESKSEFFHEIYTNLTSVFNGREILEYFNEKYLIDIFPFHCKT